MTEDSIKIVVPYRKAKEFKIKNKLLIPVQTGCAITGIRYKNLMWDNDGDNISDRNPKFCELTAQYWAWKNYDKVGNPDYIGFMQARRHFIFDENLKHTPYTWIPQSQIYYLGRIPMNYSSYFSEDKIKAQIEDKPDCIVHKLINLNLIKPEEVSDIKSHLINLSITTNTQKVLEIFETFESIIKKDYPEYYPTYTEFKNNTVLYCCNSFIMPKKLFFEYMDFAYGVLNKVDNAIDSSGFNVQESRFLGYLGEYLLTIFILHQKKINPDFKLKELSGVFLCDDYKYFLCKMRKYKLLTYLPFTKKHDYYVEKYNYFKSKLGII